MPGIDNRPGWSRWIDGVWRSCALFALGATATKITEDALGGESGPVDEGLMLFLHSHVPLALMGFFEAVSFSASAPVLTSLTIAGVGALVIAKRRFEATLLASSVILSALVVYAVKTIVGRERPALWDTQWYWGSSFPSGHTLVVAAFAAASRRFSVGFGRLLASPLWWDPPVGRARGLFAPDPGRALANGCSGCRLCRYSDPAGTPSRIRVARAAA